MSSVPSRYAQTNNAVYINIKDIRYSIFDSNLNQVAWTFQNSSIQGKLSTVGAAVLRDMGQTVYVPDLKTGAVPSTILRSVQYIPAGGVANGTDPSYYTGYIRIGSVDGTPSGVARIQ